MLSVAVVKGAGQAATYFDKDNYYLSGSEGPSTWWGAAATAAGLSGAVDRQQFETALNGKLPDGTQLGVAREGKETHKPGWDLTWSAPKSVSLMALVAGDSRLVAAHDAAVRAAMAHVQVNLAHTRVRTDGQVSLVRTDNLAAALFRHDLNRDQEPQLHTHAVVLNATRTPDGKWRSLESRPIFREIKELGAIYRSFLAIEVRRLGYQIAPGKNATFEIAGVSQDTMDRFSSRSAAVEEALSRRGLTRATATTDEKMNAALITRRGKEAIDRMSLQQTWRNRVGDALPLLDRLRQESAAAAQPSAKFNRTEVSNARQAVLSAIASLAEREHAFSHDRLHQTALRLAIGQANPDTIDQSIARLVQDKILVPRTVTTEPDREDRADVAKLGYTTQNAIRAEMRLFALLDRAKGAANPIVSLSVARAAVEAAEHAAGTKGYEWNPDQRAATIGLLRSRDSVALLQGWAGTAKTSTVLATVAATAQAAGFRVEALAPTRSAAKTIGDALNTQGDTVHNFLGRRAREANQPRTIGERLKALFHVPRELWIIDEMSLLGTGKTVELLEAARERGAKVLLTGDRLQLGSVEAGKAFSQAQNRSLDVFRLNEIVRQKTRPGRDAVRSAIERNAGAVLQFLESDAGRVEERSEQNERIQMMAERYAGLTPEQRNNTLLIDPSRDGNEAIKEAVRTLLQQQGELSGPTAPGKRLLDAGLTNADKTFAVSYNPASILRAGGRVQGIDGTLERNEYAVVTGVDAPRGQLQLQKPDGETLTVLLASLDPTRLDVFEERPGDLRRGDRIRWNRNDRQIGLARGDFGIVTDIQGNLASISFDAGVTHTFDITQRQNQHYDYGYAVTAYGAQGQTKDWIFHAESWRINLINWRSFYVGISRGETSGTIITDNREHLIAAVAARAGEKSAAIDTNDLARSVRHATETAMTTELTNNLAATTKTDNTHEPLRTAAKTKLITIKSPSENAGSLRQPPTRHQEPEISPD